MKKIIRKNNLWIALLVFICAKSAPYLIQGSFGVSIAAFFEIVALVYLIFGIIGYRINDKKEKIYKYSIVGVVFIVIVIGGNFLRYEGLSNVNSSPKLIIKEPLEGAVVNGSTTQVLGLTDKDTLVNINGKPILLNENAEFNEEITLNRGSNTIIVKVRNKFNKEITKTISVSASF